MLFPKTLLFLLPGGCCSSLHRMERSRGCPLMAGAERQNVTGNLCHLCWDGPPAPKETFYQLPLALLRLPGAAARREQPNHTLTMRHHNELHSCGERWLFFWKPPKGPWILLQWPSVNGTSSPVVFRHKQTCTFNSQCHVCEFPPIFSGYSGYSSVIPASFK